jgi:hypothetical protein
MKCQPSIHCTLLPRNSVTQRKSIIVDCMNSATWTKLETETVFWREHSNMNDVQKALSVQHEWCTEGTLSPTWMMYRRHSQSNMNDVQKALSVQHEWCTEGTLSPTWMMYRRHSQSNSAVLQYYQTTSILPEVESTPIRFDSCQAIKLSMLAPACTHQLIMLCNDRVGLLELTPFLLHDSVIRHNFVSCTVHDNITVFPQHLLQQMFSIRPPHHVHPLLQ